MFFNIDRERQCDVLLTLSQMKITVDPTRETHYYVRVETLARAGFDV